MAAQPLAERRKVTVTTPAFEGRTIPCPLCAGTDLTCVSQVDRHGGRLKTDMCRGCGHVFTNPQPTQDELDAYYGQNYRADYKKVTTPKLKHVYRAGLRAMERLDRLQAHVKPDAMVLDVGAGGGEFVYLLTRMGYSAKGLEPNEGYAAHARAAYDIDIAIGTIEGNLPESGTWDVITLHHVLEHLADPIRVLRSLAAGLVERGRIIVEVPNAEARYHAPKRRFHFAHLHTFSADGLHLAAAKAGMRVTDLITQPHTGHLNAVIVADDSVTASASSDTAARIGAFLTKESGLKDHLTPRPYRRLWANVKRPVREGMALRRLGSPGSAKQVLESLYAPVIATQQPNSESV